MLARGVAGYVSCAFDPIASAKRVVAEAATLAREIAIFFERDCTILRYRQDLWGMDESSVEQQKAEGNIWIYMLTVVAQRNAIVRNLFLVKERAGREA